MELYHRWFVMSSYICCISGVITILLFLVYRIPETISKMTRLKAKNNIHIRELVSIRNGRSNTRKMCKTYKRAELKLHKEDKEVEKNNYICQTTELLLEDTIDL